MSISSSGTRKAGPFSGNGSTTVFPFSFKVFQASDVLAVQTDTTPADHTLALNTDYTVALNANQDANPGGTVNLAAALPSGYLLTIGSNVPALQSVTLTNNGGFYPAVINTALDYLTILIQQLSEKIGRALVMPFSTNASGQLPPVAPGQLLGWKADGSGIDNVGASGVGAGSIVASNMAAGAAGTALSADTQAATAKAAPADADEIPLFDSASFWYLRRFTWANLKAALAGFIGTLLNMTGAINEARTTVASAATPDIWTGSGNIINYTGTAIATGFAAAPQAGARRVLDCAGAAVFTAGANMLIDGVASGANLAVSAGDRVEVLARTTTQFVLRQMKADGTAVGGSQPVAGGFKNLQASATGLGANVSVTADELVLESASGVAYKASAVSLILNSAGTGPNGLDTGTLAASTWYSVWAIYNPTTGTVAGLLSASFTAPTLPSGYTFKARVGAIRTDGTANKYPLSFKQNGRRVAYVVAAGSNVTALPAIITGVQGNPSTPTWVAASISTFFPATVASIKLLGQAFNSSGLIVAPNNSYGAFTSSSNPPPMVVWVNATGNPATSGFVEMIPESTNVYYASGVSTSGLFAIGWEDNL